MSDVKGEFGRTQERPSPTDGDGAVAPSTEWNEAERGRITWLSSGEDEGPDCGLVLGLGDGWSLHVGEFADATLRECGVDLAETSAPSGWWSAICGPDGFQIVGPVIDHEAARAMIDRAFAAVQSTTASGTPTPPSDGEGGAQRSEAEPTEHKASTSPAVEAEVANLIEQLLAFECPCHECTLHADAANALERLASEKARLEAQDARSLAEINLWAERQREVGELYAAERSRADKAEADLSALKQRVAEVIEPFVCFEEQGRQLLADARQEDDKSASRLFNSWNFRPFPTWGNFRRAAELHASLRSSEGHPTDEGRRANNESHAQSIKGEDHGK